jgi:hypothetical protein
MDNVTILIAGTACLLGGGYVGWWLRARHYSVERARLAEYWTRKEQNFQNEIDRAQVGHTRESTRARDFEQRMQARNEELARLKAGAEEAAERDARAAKELAARGRRANPGFFYDLLFSFLSCCHCASKQPVVPKVVHEPERAPDSQREDQKWNAHGEC